VVGLAVNSPEKIVVAGQAQVMEERPSALVDVAKCDRREKHVFQRCPVMKERKKTLLVVLKA
jgi:hypothetical protein